MIKEAIRSGCEAPPFTLPNHLGNNVSLKDLRGQWVVLYFYVRDDTPGCTMEACEFTSILDEFAKLNTRVFGISPDSPESHREFISKHRIKVELLSDPSHEVMDEYGAWGERDMFGRKTLGVLRSTVLIDPKGQIAYHWPDVKAEGHAKTVREKLAELRAKWHG